MAARPVWKLMAAMAAMALACACLTACYVRSEAFSSENLLKSAEVKRKVFPGLLRSSRRSQRFSSVDAVHGLRGGAGGPIMPQGMPQGIPPGMAGMGMGPPPPSLGRQIAELHPLKLSLITTVAWNLLGFIISASSRTYTATDLFGTSAFTLSALVTMQTALFTQWNMIQRNWEKPVRPLILAAAVGLWATRLGAYLTTRMSRLKSDKRVQKHFRKPGEVWLCGDSCYPINLLAYWMRQALWAWVCLLPVTMASDLKQYQRVNGDDFSKAIAPVALALGSAGFVLGLGLETIADYQKYTFKTDRNNPKRWRWCDKGLWSLARHPNYLGEMIVWASLFLISYPAAPLWTIISPVFVWFLLRYKTGIPMLEEDMKAKYWSHPEFEKYMSRTNLLVPLPGKKSEPQESLPYGIGSAADDV